MAAGVNIWLGGSSSNVETAGNWSDGVPDDGDDVIFDRTSTNGPQGDLRTSEDVDLASLRFLPGFTNNVGVDSSTPLIFDTATVVECNCNGGPSQYIYLSLTTITSMVVLNTPGGVGLYIPAADFTGQVIINGGNVTFGASCTFAAGCKIKINQSGSGIRPNVNFLAGGSFNSATRVQLGNGTIISYTPIAGLIDILPMGVMYHRPSTGTPTLANVQCQGTLSIEATTDTTVTLAEGWGNGKIVTDQSTSKITFTTSTANDDSRFYTRPGLDVHSAATVSGNGRIPASSTSLSTSGAA